MSSETTPKASRYALEERLEHAEELLAAGVPSGAVAKRLAAKFAISRRQARRYVQQVHERREKQRAADAPYRRENFFRKLEHAYAKCMSEKKYGPAIQALVTEARFSGAFDHAVDREALLERLGPPPKDAGEMLIYTRRVLTESLYETMASPHLDVEKRLRIISDIAFKIAATQSRTEVEAAILRLEALVSERALPGAVRVVDATTIELPPTARGQRDRHGPRPLPPMGPDADEDDPPGGENP